MIRTLLILAMLTAGDPSATPPADLITLQTSPAWRDRDQAARLLGAGDWRRHPEVAAGLADALRHDADRRVRAEAARSLGRLVVLLPSSHTALDDAARSDPARLVRHEATRALAARGRRCLVDCPICGPLPRHSVITGPTIRLPEWADPAGSGPAPTRSDLPDALPRPAPPQR